MGQRTDNLGWPGAGPIVVDTYTVADPTTQQSLAEVPPASIYGSWLAEHSYVLGSLQHLIGVRIQSWSAQRTDCPIVRKTEGGQTHYGMTGPGQTILNLFVYGAGTPNVELQGLVIHEAGHLKWFLDFGEHSQASDGVWATFGRLRGVGTDDDEEVYAEDIKCLFGTAAIRGQHLYAAKYGLPGPEIAWHIRRASNVIKSLRSRPFYGLKYQIHPQWSGGGYWTWNNYGYPEYSNGDGIVYRLLNNTWVRQP